MELVTGVDSNMSMGRLNPANVDGLGAAIGRPGYERKALRCGIVHLGIGAFARAHLAAVNEEAIEHSGDMRFGIIGVSMRSADTRDALEPQSGLYTLALRDADPQGRPRQRLRVIGNLIGLMVAPEDPAAVVARIAHADTRIVSLSVTEKGYCHDPASGRLRAEHADIAHDLSTAQAHAPRSAIGMIARGLQRRMRSGLGPVTLMSIDNLPSNGNMLRALLIDFGSRVDDALAAWIERECSFPNSMVDRIVPRTAPADRRSISASLGLLDEWPVVAEPYIEWAVEDRFCAGRPNWNLGGARFVESASCHERLKLRMVNASHSALAYLAAGAGVPSVDAAMGMPGMRGYLRRLMRDEIAPTLGAVPGVDIDAFQEQLLARFANPALAHQTHQIATDGSQKLPQRWLGTVREGLAAGRPVSLLALAVAAWLRYLEGTDEAGHSYPVDDPLAHELENQRIRAEAHASIAASASEAERCRVATMLSFTPVFGELCGCEILVDAVAEQALSLRQRGIYATLVAAARPTQSGMT